MSTGRWSGLLVIDDRLWFARRPSSPRRVRLDVEGIELVASGREPYPLDWGRGFTGSTASYKDWWAYGRHAGRYTRARFTVAYGHNGLQPSGAKWHLYGGLAISPGTFLVDEMQGLLAYLCATPAARTALRDPDRLHRLVDDVHAADSSWREPVPVLGLLGDRRRIDQAIDRAFDRCWHRRFARRPFAGEPVPTLESLVGPSREELGTELSARVSDDDLEARLQRALTVLPWPFTALVD